MARPKKDEPSERVALPRSTARRIRRLAAHADREPGEWLAEVVAPLLDRAEAKMITDMVLQQNGFIAGQAGYVLLQAVEFSYKRVGTPAGRG